MMFPLDNLLLINRAAVQPLQKKRDLPTIFFNCTFAAFFPSEEIGECIQPLFCTLLIFRP